jgi:uncharacterized protein (DUF1330 family)
MPAYIILIRDEPTRNAEAMAEYQRLNRKNADKFAATLTPLVVYGAVEALEGPTPDGVLLLRFDDSAAARAWYNSPDYQAALPHRLRAADYRAFIVEGL